MSVTYNKTNWQNLPTTTTPLSASNLNKIEQGIYDVAGLANANAHDIAALTLQISGMSGGVPPTASSTAGMDTTISPIWVNTTDGNWYYYNGSAWTPGGEYGGAVTDTTLSISGSAADAKAVGDALADISIDVDDTLTQEGEAADAKAVGDALDGIDTRVTALESGTNTEQHEYTYVKPSLIRCNWDWSANSGGTLCKTDVKAMPQYIILNKAVACNANGVKMCSATEDFATPLNTPFAHIFKMTYPANEMVETHLYGEDDYKYFRMLLPYSADLEVTFVYDTWRPSNDISVLKTELGTADVDFKIGFMYPESTSRLRAFVVVPF